MLGDLVRNMTMTVKQLNDYAANLLERDEVLQGLLVAGELSNFKHHSSGHMYFTLKDESAAIRCVMFRQDAQSVDFNPADGAKVTVGGYVSLYRKEGQFQLHVKSMRLEGVGQLYEQFEKLKAKLEAEGLFDPLAKKALPPYPRRIGVATSRMGAVIRDIISVATRRNLGVDILLYPVAVQGQGAEFEIKTAIEYLDAVDDIDVIIIGRGGGSMEDLWAFNEEVLARAVYACQTPIVSAVGHETDYSISDFVADMRAPTPSAAAELVVPRVEEVLLGIDSLVSAAQGSLFDRMQQMEQRMGAIVNSQQVAGIHSRVGQCEQQVGHWGKLIANTVQNKLGKTETMLDYLAKACESASPATALERGYSLVIDTSTGRTIRSINEIVMGTEATVRFADGRATAVFTGQIEKEDA